MKLPTYQELSREQDNINDLPLDGNWLVTGPPGTGKSVMALYRTKMLADLDRPVTLLMWSRLLRMYVERALATLDLDDTRTSTFDRWINSYWRKNFGSNAPQSEPYQYVWDEIHRKLGEVGVQRETPDMIIDEGQDLPKDFYVLAGLLCDHLTVFADEDQTINNDRRSSVSEIQSFARIKDTFELRKNYRNSRPIAEVAAHLFDGRPELEPELPDPSRTGPKPVLRGVSKFDESVTRVATWAKNNDATTVGVFTPTVAIAKKVAEKLTERGVRNVQLYHRQGRTAPAIDFDQPGVLVTYFGNSKGLEFDSVFVVETQKSKLLPGDQMTRNIFYVLASRARTNLEFHWSGDGMPDLMRLFDGAPVERK